MAEKNLEATEKDKEFSKWMQEFYNRRAGQQTKDNYEKFRWFLNKRKRKQYILTTRALLFHLRDLKFKNCLEIGCGPGTWTRLLIKKYPNAKFTCLDISKEMISQFKNNIKNKNVKTIVNDFLQEEIKGKYDFIFSSRAIEYIPNKPLIIKKIYDLMESGAKGMIVTSPPHPFFLGLKRFFGRKVNIQHTKRISVKNMKWLLSETGFKNIIVYPILFTDNFPIPSKLLFELCYRNRWGLLSKLFASGYVVKFEKP